MRKNILVVIIILNTLGSSAQYVNSIGITGGLSLGNEKFYLSDPLSISKKKYVLGYNGSIFVEFFNGDYARWVSEIQYNQKGSKDKQSEGNYSNKLNYICWNNYLKLRYELYRIIPYVLFGPRLEYNITQKTSSPAITGKFNPFQLSFAVGSGIEFISYGNVKFFTEAFYNPDLLMAYNSSQLKIKNKNIEIRIGLKYQFGNKKETCNTPTYVE